jgi:hypothetical protein
MIREKKYFTPTVIDLDGPDGNAFCLLAAASSLSSSLELDGERILKEMQSGDYINLLQVFEKHFSKFVILESKDSSLIQKVNNESTESKSGVEQS